MCLLISEIFIFFYTRSKQNRTEKIDTRDLGTKWLLYLNFVFCLIISFLCISQKAPFCIRELTLPAYFAKIGMLITAVGICIRIKAVLTLKKAFTLNVQISKEQQLITNGMYKFVRHPAYTGSILSLLGVSIALKNIPAILIVAICSFVCYQIRINVEEAVLQKYFKEYNLYKEKTYKLFPYIY
jgi:protein-S-isoprenylcysteine O-methyltransferase Ste14